LQASCWLVQLRLQAPLLPAPAGFASVAEWTERTLNQIFITAVTVIDDNGVPIGIVSEGDLIRPDRAAREAWRQSWLEVFAEGEPLAPELLDWLHSQSHSARTVMSAPLITVSEDAELGEIARVLVTHRIQRVPVVRDGRVTGIIARGDLLRVLAANKADL
jgi:CBS domain-containing protein